MLNYAIVFFVIALIAALFGFGGTAAVGLRNERFAEVESLLQGGPLDEGTLVVVSDHLTLAHDAKVKVRRVVDMTVAWSAAAED